MKSIHNLSHVRMPVVLMPFVRMPLVRMPLVVATLTIATILGCGQSDRPKTIPVRGTITVDGEPPAFPGGVFFAPVEVEPGYPRRGGRALFDPDGTYEVTSFEEGDGLVPGTYRVRVESWKEPPSMGKPGVSYVPKGFAAADLIVSSSEKSIQHNLDLAQ